jgi:hypothetical protein
MHRHRFTFQRARTIRRPLINDKRQQYIHQFLDQLREIYDHNQPEFIFNMDETNVGQTETHTSVIAIRNCRERRVASSYNHKTLLTACFTIRADGVVMPPYYIRKGKTFRSLSVLELDDRVERGMCLLTRDIDRFRSRSYPVLTCRCYI